jgi:hypothetical protein
MSKGKRRSLKHMTPEEKAEYVRERERQKKARQRDRQKIEGKKLMTESPQAKTNWPRATLTPELEEFIDELVALPLEPASRALAMWERENRQRLRLVPPSPYGIVTQADADAYQVREKRARRFGLIGMFASDAFERDAGRDRNKRYLEKEAAEANKLGISIEEHRRRKRAKRAPKRREEQFVVAKGVLEKRVDDANTAALKEAAVF